jgi:hypothetical protein
MEGHELAFADGGNGAAIEPQLALAVTALESATPAEALFAFEDAAAVFARQPNALNAHKVELTMRALRHHAKAKAVSTPEWAAGP